MPTTDFVLYRNLCVLIEEELAAVRGQRDVWLQRDGGVPQCIAALFEKCTTLLQKQTGRAPSREAMCEAYKAVCQKSHYGRKLAMQLLLLTIDAGAVPVSGADGANVVRLPVREPGRGQGEGGG